MIGSLVTFFAVGLITLVVAGVVLSIVGAVLSLGIGLAMFLLTKVAPVLLVGWVVMKVIEKKTGGGGGELSAADRRWLDSD